MPDFSYIVWYFALAIIVVIITITIVKIRGRRKKVKIKRKEIPKEAPKKEEIYFEPKGGEYRTEYY